MRVQIALRMPNNTIAYRIFDGVQALINPRNVLQIYYMYNKRLVAEYPPDSFISWQYVTPPLQPTSRANLLLQHHEK